MHSISKLCKFRLINFACKNCWKFEIINYYSSEEGLKLRVERLKSRSLLSIEGCDSEEFLQNLITHDIRCLNDNSKCLFAAFLNHQGNVLHDTIIYKPPNRGHFLVECDGSSIDALKIHLLMNQKNKNVNILSVEENFKVWVIYSPKEEKVDCLGLGEDILVCPDPRISELGLRVIAPSNVNVTGAVARAGHSVYVAPERPLYRLLRYKLGVGEGSSEIPYGKLTSWEVNLDYLNGISHEKGYFVGKERLSKAKSQLSGNRLLPIFLDTSRAVLFPLNTPIEDALRKRKAPVGFLRGIKGTIGLALMRVTQALQEEHLRIGNITAHCLRPLWWPQET